MLTTCVDRRGRVLVVVGDVDAATAGALEAAIGRLHHPRPVVDLRGVDLFTAAGVSVIVRTIHRDGPTIEFRLSAAVQRTLDICGFDTRSALDHAPGVRIGLRVAP